MIFNADLDPQNTVECESLRQQIISIDDWGISSVSDPDLHGFALILLPCIRIRIGNADPDPGARKLAKINK